MRGGGGGEGLAVGYSGSHPSGLSPLEGGRVRVRPKKMAKVEYLVHSWPVCDFFTKTKQADRFSVGKNELRGIVK